MSGLSDAERFWAVLASPIDTLVDIPSSDRVYWVVRLARYLYGDLGQTTGGPLHIQLDDGNLDDRWIQPNPDRYAYLWNGEFESYAQAGDDVSENRRRAIEDTCERILALLRLMPEVERRVAYSALGGELYRGQPPMAAPARRELQPADVELLRKDPKAPSEPTSEQCNANEQVPNPYGGQAPAYAVWWPQMGGYSSRAVITATDCPEAFVWHDGQFPFDGDKRNPVELHLCDADQWIELFTKQKTWAREYADEDYEPEPYRWDLPHGVTREQGIELYEKALAWGLWEPDPGGFIVRTWEEAQARMAIPCVPQPCPPFEEVDEYSPQAHPTAADLVRAGIDIERFGPPRPGRDLAQVTIDQSIKVPAEPDVFKGLDGLRAAMEAALRPPPGAPRGPALIPRIVTLPEDVATEQAWEWIRGCERLGLIEPNEAGTLTIPHGVTW